MKIYGGSPQSFEPWISGWILSDLSNFHPTSSERSGRSHCSSGRLLCRLITASPHVPCWAAPALSPPAPSTPHHQKMSVFIAAEQRRWSRRVLWHSVRERWGGGVGALYQVVVVVVVVVVGALYQARTRSRLLPTHRPWRLTTPPSPFFAGCGGSY